MIEEFVETEIPVKCSWCDQDKVLFLGVQASSSDPLISLVLCPACDESSLPLMRRRVIATGRLEERNQQLVWVPSRLASYRQFDGRDHPHSSI